jgi:hypothetical protein
MEKFARVCSNLCNLQPSSKKMNQPLMIRKLLSSLLLAVFFIGIMPKIFLHDLLAAHNDIALSIDSHTDQIDKVGFRCNCDHLVVESPFIPSCYRIELFVPVCFSDVQEHFFYDDLRSCVIRFGLRGPPAMA